MTRRPPVSLNTLSFDAAFALVRDALRRGVALTALYVDTVGDPERYAARLRSEFPSIGTVVVAKKADATYRVVGAASIAAKCKRDRDLRSWVFEEEHKEEAEAPAVVGATGGGATGGEAAAGPAVGRGDGSPPLAVAVPNGGGAVWDDGGSDGEVEGDAEGALDGNGAGGPSAAAPPPANGNDAAGAATPTWGRAFGSGYPGDAVTKAWLAAHVDPVFGFPSLVRFSWSACARGRGVRAGGGVPSCAPRVGGRGAGRRAG